MLQNRLFAALASRSGFGAAVSEAVARSSIVFCDSVAADRIVVAAKGAVWSVKTVKCEVWRGASSVTCEAGHNFRRVHARTGLAGARRMQVL